MSKLQAVKDRIRKSEEKERAKIFETMCPKEKRRKIKVVEKFRNLIRPLEDNELKELRESIKTEGIRDPLVIWSKNREWLLVDGHHRNRIANELDLDIQIKLKFFEDEYEVVDWMIRNQKARRNLTREELTYLNGVQYNNIKSKQGGSREIKSLLNNLSNNENKAVTEKKTLNTAEKLAQENKITGKKIKESGIYSEVLDNLPQEVKHENLKGAGLGIKEVTGIGTIIRKEVKEAKKENIKDEELEELKRKRSEELYRQKQEDRKAIQRLKDEEKEKNQLEKIKEKGNLQREKIIFKDDMSCCQFMKSFENDFVDLLISEPEEEFRSSIDTFLNELKNKLKSTGRAFLILSQDNLYRYLKAVNEIFLDNHSLHYEYSYDILVLNYKIKYCSELPLKDDRHFFIPSNKFVLHIYSDKSRKLKTDKARDFLSRKDCEKEELIYNLIKWSTDEGDVVIDPFYENILNLALKLGGRKCYGCKA